MKCLCNLQNMKVWIVLWAIICVCWLSMIDQQRRRYTASEYDELNNMRVDIMKVKFTTRGATRNSYLMFMKDLYNALTVRANRNGLIPVLPVALQANDPRQYVLVELSDGYGQTVTLALDVSTVYILGYHAGGSDFSYFFGNISIDVRNALFNNTQRRSLSFDGDYGSLQTEAGVDDRREIPLGIGELDEHIRNMNIVVNPNCSTIARALLVCIQMISEAVRFRNIQQQILAVADPNYYGYYGSFEPNWVTLGYENIWGPLSERVQTATDGIFTTPVSFRQGPVDEMIFNTVRQVLFQLAITKYICRRGANGQLLRMPAASLPHMSTTGLEDDSHTCEVALAPTTHITGLDGLCVDVYHGRYYNGNKIILWVCENNTVNQLWTLRSDDNTIRSGPGGKYCLTYDSGNHVMIYDCDTAASDATKWRIQSDGSIINPKSGLALTASTVGLEEIDLVVQSNMYGSPKQAWYASNTTKPPVTTIVGYKGLCLLAAGNQVWLETCLSGDVEQQWAIYPDGTIRPQKNRLTCLEYGDAGADSVTVGSCDGWVEKRWRFQSDGTIWHVYTGQVMDVKDTNATLPEITVNNYSYQRLLSQIWFQV